MKKKINVAVVGTGAVGQALLQVLAERDFPVAELKVLATKRSAGKKVEFKGEEYTIEETAPDSFSGVHLALFAGGEASRLFAPAAVKEGAVVIDNSSSFRLDPQVPLVVPEVNPEDVKWHKGIIANPNCSTIQLVVALKPLYDAAGIERVIISTYQAVSGAGQEAVEELKLQSREVLEGRPVTAAVFPWPIAFNCLPHIDVFQPNGYTREEMKMVHETRKIMKDENLKISATAVRVPVFVGHCEAVHVETREELSVEEVREIFRRAPGVVLMDDPEKKLYPLPIQVAGKDEVYIGRLRKDLAVDRGLSMWVVADNLRKGAATNAVQIAELLLKESLL